MADFSLAFTVTNGPGRKWAFNLTCLITSVFGLLIAAPPHNFDAVCAIVALSSFGLGGNIPIGAFGRRTYPWKKFAR